MTGEKCSPIIDRPYDNTSTLTTTSPLSQLTFFLQHEVNNATTVTSATWSIDGGKYPRTSTEKRIEEALYRVVIVCVCVFGLVCNIINLVVLSRKSLTATMERLERSAHYGLIGKTQSVMGLLHCEPTKHVIWVLFITLANFGRFYRFFLLLYSQYSVQWHAYSVAGTMMVLLKNLSLRPTVNSKDFKNRSTFARVMN